METAAQYKPMYEVDWLVSGSNVFRPTNSVLPPYLSGGHRRAVTRRVAPYMLLPHTCSSSPSFVVFDSPAVGDGDEREWGGRLEKYLEEVRPDCVLVVMSLSEFEAEEGKQFLTLEELVDAVRDAQGGKGERSGMAVHDLGEQIE